MAARALFNDVYSNFYALMKKTTEWPVRYKEMLLYGDPQSNVGVVCHWTLKETIDNELKERKYLVLGNLYSGDIGISSIIRNVLAHPRLDTIILCGSEGSINETKSGRAFLSLIENGVDERHKIVGSENFAIEKEIPIKAINAFRKRVSVINILGENNASAIEKEIKRNLKEEGQTYETFVFPEPEATENTELPSEAAVFTVRRNTVAECWIDILENIMAFGKIKGSQYGERQKELIDVISVIEAEDPERPYLPDYLPLTEGRIKDYIPTITTPSPVEGAKYTYGQRMREHGGVDQIENLINQISESPFSRRAVVSLWDVGTDSSGANPPCLDLAQALVRGNKLYLTAYIRSNDMFSAWPENAFGFLALRDLIIKEVNKKNPILNLEAGSLIIISSSAHIYERSWEGAKKILKGKPNLKCAWDKRGHFVISVKNGLINVYNSNSPENLRWSGKTAREIMDKIVFYVSIFPHAMYLGAELNKAETALKLGLKYVQDCPLDLT